MERGNATSQPVRVGTRLSCASSGQVTSSVGGSNLSVITLLRGSVESIAEVHEECVTAPLEVILDIGVREPCMVEELSCRNSYQVTGP